MSDIERVLADKTIADHVAILYTRARVFGLSLGMDMVADVLGDNNTEKQQDKELQDFIDESFKTEGWFFKKYFIMEVQVSCDEYLHYLKATTDTIIKSAEQGLEHIRDKVEEAINEEKEGIC